MSNIRNSISNPFTSTKCKGKPYIQLELFFAMSFFKFYWNLLNKKKVPKNMNNQNFFSLLKFRLKY